MEPRKNDKPVSTWLGLNSEDGSDADSSSDISLAKSMPIGKKILIFIIWGFVCLGAFFFFKEMKINVAAALLAVSLFTNGIAVISSITVHRKN